MQNIDSILQRGERLDLLVDKTDTLAGQAYAFRRGARAVRRQQWWKNTKITVLTGVVCIVSCLYLSMGTDTSSFCTSCSRTGAGSRSDTAGASEPLHLPTTNALYRETRRDDMLYLRMSVIKRTAQLRAGSSPLLPLCCPLCLTK